METSKLEQVWLGKMGLTAAEWSRLSAEERAQRLRQMGANDRVILPEEVVAKLAQRLDAFCGGSSDQLPGDAEESCALPPPPAPAEPSDVSSVVGLRPAGQTPQQLPQRGAEPVPTWLVVGTALVAVGLVVGTLSIKRR